MRLMREYDVVALPNDKDGGFCCVARSVLDDLRLDMVRSVQYQEDDPLAINWDSLVRSYRSIARQIASFEEDSGLYGELVKSLHGGRFKAVLRNTVKSHKPCGSVALRPIHAMRDWCMSGVARWLVVNIRRCIGSVSHIVHSSADFVNFVKIGSRGQSVVREA